MTVKEFAAVTTAVVVSAAGAAVGTFLFADWVIGAGATVLRLRRLDTSKWVWQ